MIWRVRYQLYSGILFVTLGLIIFIRAKGYVHIFSAGLFALLLVAFGAYRIVLYVRLAKKPSGNNP
jgi:uncharacterized membrane protein HdeD (DUF308 family)